MVTGLFRRSKVHLNAWPFLGSRDSLNLAQSALFPLVEHESTNERQNLINERKIRERRCNNYEALLVKLTNN